MLIHERSKGVPRTISVICDNALVHGFALGRHPVDRGMVLDVCRDFDLTAARVEQTEPSNIDADRQSDEAPAENEERQLFDPVTPPPRRVAMFGSRLDIE
jgi:hypothetical protein